MKDQSPALASRSGRLESWAVVILAAASGLAADTMAAQRPAPPLPAPAVRETATFQAGGTVFWLRATDAGKVLVYAARGFRTPFARPSTLSAEETDRWAELAASLIAAADGAGPMPVVSSASTHGNRSGAVFGDGDLELEIPSGDVSSAVIIRVGAAGPEAISATLSAAVLRDVVPALRATARAAREMAATRLAAVGATRSARAFASVLPVTRLTTPAASAPRAIASVALQRSEGAVAPTAAPAPRMLSTSTGVPVMRSTVGGAAALAMREEPATIAAAPIAYVPTVVGTAPSRPHSTSSVAPSVGVEAAPAVPTVARSLAMTAAGRPIATAGVGGTAVASAASLDTGRVGGVGGLAASTVGNVVRQRQPLLAYCYTAFGLASDSSLSGRTTMRVALSRAGAVVRAEIVDRHWWGRGAEQVESCVHDRVMAWRFPAAARASLQEFQLYFNH